MGMTRLLACAILGSWLCHGTSASAAESKVVTIAVLPFENVTKNAEINWLGYGFAETLATKLSKALQELKLQDTAVVDPKTAGKLGKVVGARYVIIGSYQKAGDSLKADARRVEVETSVASGGVDVTGEFAKVFSLQSELALKLAAALGKTPTESESETIAKPPTKSLTAYEWLSKGNTQYGKSDYDGAIASYSRAIELDANYDVAYYDRGNVYSLKADYNRAIADYDRAIAINPKGAVVYNNRGIAYDRSRQPDRAIVDYDTALSINPNYADAYINRGIAYRSKGDYARAIADYNTALSINPNDVKAYNNRGNTYLDSGDPDRALADFNKALAIWPNDALLHNNRGNAYYHKADYNRAIADYDKATSIDPNYAIAYYWKGQAAIKAERYPEALEALRKFVEIAPPGDPNVENARKLIEAL